MKQRGKNRFAIQSVVSRLSLCAIVVVGLLISTAGASLLAPLKASAAIPSDAALTRQGEASAACKQDISYESDPRLLPTCGKGYLTGYKNPNANKDTMLKYCNNFGIGTAACQAGYKAGQADRKTADKQGAKPAPTGNLTDNQIGAFGKTNTVCAQLVGSGTPAEIDDCITGYVNGYKGKSESICDNGKVIIFPIQCKQGYGAGVSDKKHNVKNSSQQIAASPAAANTPSSNNSSTVPSCDASGFSLSWIFCPIIEGLAKAVDGIYSNLVQPLLKTNPIELAHPDKDPTHTYAIWSNFRIYGDVFLVIALLVIVFGESIGGGMIDAYAAKKILPRLLIAAIFINLSIYIVALAVDITNILGYGLSALIEAPFKNIPGGFKLSISGATGDLGVGALAAGGIWAALALGPLLEFLFLFILIPAFLTFIAVLVTLLVRQGLIIFLILSSPIAFALYCLPNTEQYFRKWWELLLRTLLVFPIIAGIFALANVLSVTINSSTSVPQVFAQLLSVVALLVPLFLIPYSFRIAGGALGRLHGVATNYRQRGHEAIKGNANDQTSWRNMTKRKLANRTLSQRERAVNTGISMQKNRKTPFGRIAGGGLASVAGLGNYQLRRSIKNKDASDVVQAQIATGDDSTVRAMFASKRQYRDKGGNVKTGWFGTTAREGNDGMVIGQQSPQFSEFEMRKAKSSMAHDSSYYQAGLTYEIGKAGDDYELGQIREANVRNTQESPWLSAAGGGTWKGAGFSHAQTRRELKHESFKPDSGTYERDSRAFTREVAENVGNYSLSNMRTSTVNSLTNDYQHAQAYLAANDANATATQRQAAQADLARFAAPSAGNAGVKAVANTEDARQIVANVQATANSLNMRAQMGGSYALAGEEGETPIAGSQSGASGKVTQSIDNLINVAATNQPARRSGSRGPGGTTGPGAPGGGGLATPGSPGFNVPPGSRPGGENFR